MDQMLCDNGGEILYENLWEAADAHGPEDFFFRLAGAWRGYYQMIWTCHTPKMSWDALARADVNKFKDLIHYREGDYMQCLDDAFQGFYPHMSFLRHYFSSDKAGLVKDLNDLYAFKRKSLWDCLKVKMYATSYFDDWNQCTNSVADYLVYDHNQLHEFDRDNLHDATRASKVKWWESQVRG